jgi:hypothetical protein
LVSAFACQLESLKRECCLGAFCQVVERIQLESGKCAISLSRDHCGAGRSKLRQIATIRANALHFGPPHTIAWRAFQKVCGLSAALLHLIPTSIRVFTVLIVLFQRKKRYIV